MNIKKDAPKYKVLVESGTKNGVEMPIRKAHFSSIPNKCILAEEIEKIAETVEMITFSDLSDKIEYIDFSPCTKINSIEHAGKIVRENEKRVSEKYFIFSITTSETYSLDDFVKNFGPTSNFIILIASRKHTTSLYMFSAKGETVNLSTETNTHEVMEERIQRLVAALDSLAEEEEEDEDTTGCVGGCSCDDDAEEEEECDEEEESTVTLDRTAAAKEIILKRIKAELDKRRDDILALVSLLEIEDLQKLKI